MTRALLGSLLLDGTNIDARAFSIAPALASGKFVAPPTYIAHGSIDDKVPPRQSTDVVKAMKERKQSVEFELFEGYDHLFDKNPTCDMEKMYHFIRNLVY